MYDLEKVKVAIEDLSESEKVGLWNEYCMANNYMDDYIEYNDIDELCYGLRPSEVLNAIDLDSYLSNDEYVANSIYGYRSFDYVDSLNSPFSANELAEYIVENEETFGYLDEDEITIDEEEF